MKKKSIYISNLGWNHKDFELIVKIIKKNEIRGIDIAPLKIFKNWNNIFNNIKIFNKILKKEQIHVNAIQGIFFKKKLNLFSNKKSDFAKIKNHLILIIKICKILKCNKIIIGSSNFRNKKNLSKLIADEIFINFFKKLKSLLNKKKIFLCLETIPKKYNEKYIFKLDHLLELIKKIDSKYVKINFDSSIFHYDKVDILSVKKNINYFKNIQITQKNFDYFLKISKENKKLLKIFKNSKKVKEISLEIIKNETNIKLLEKSLINIKLLS